jgi:hypothetical protein
MLNCPLRRILLADGTQESISYRGIVSEDRILSEILTNMSRMSTRLSESASSNEGKWTGDNR